MPNMFSRRRGSSATRSVDSSTSAAASTAASSAFLARASNSNLSSAAAAAALHSRPTTPTAVGNVQTKRMVRRGSNSSVGSSVIGSGTRGGVGRAGLQRRDSGGSMTERTFRSPSPSRPESVAAAPDAPPVPKVPAGVRGNHQRSASQQPAQRVLSPAGRGSRGVSVDRAPQTDRSSKRLSNVYEAEREDGNSLVNFSRPMSGAMSGSPTAHRSTRSGGSWFTGASGNADLSNMKPAKGSATAGGLAAHEVSGIQQGLNAAANKPVKKRQTQQNAQGSYLARANSDQPTSGATDTLDTIMVYDPHSRTFVAQPRPRDQIPEPASPTLPKAPTPKPGTYDPHTRSIVPAAQPARQQARRITTSSDVGSDSDTAPTKKKTATLSVNTEPAPPSRNPARGPSAGSSPSSPRAAGVLQKQPSVVREDPDEEEASAWQPSPTSKIIQTSAGPARAYVPQTSTPHHRSVSLDVPRTASESSGRGRGGSISPSRNAHFSATPIIEGTKHVPHRGVSPVKSAMKHSSSPSSSIRTSSPNVAASPSAYATKAGSETSEAPSLGPLEGKKKKSVRVSFDAQPHEIPDDVKTPTRSPITRERSPALDDDMEELMKPRPALPSFGSVRNRQPEVAEKVTERPPDRHEASSDHVVGGIFASEMARKGGEREEPLPPEVTSREGGGYGSDSSEEEPAMPSAAPVAQSVQKAEVPQQESDVVTQVVEKPVPQLNFQPPTPGTEEEVKLGEPKPEVAAAAEPVLAPPSSPRSRKSWESYNIPGSWGAQDDEEEVKPVAVAVPEPLQKTQVEPVKSEPVATAPVIGPLAAQPGAEPLAAQLSDISESDSDDSAAFSDAAEEQSDMEGGFASLNAILESPSPNVLAKTAVATDDSPLLGDKRPEGDWSQATAYWSRLSRQQREQIEREHLSSDDEAKPTPVAKPRKKKSALKQTAPADTGRQQATAKPEQPTLRKSMRGSQGPTPAAAPQEERVHMRTSMRGPPQSTSPAPSDDRVHMRSSMRDGSGGAAGGGMRSSMRGPPAARPQSEYTPQIRSGAASPEPRPKSAGTSLGSGAAGSAMRSRRNSEEPNQNSAFPTLGNRNAVQPPPASSRLAKQQQAVPANNDSDSESSFKKARRGGRHASNATVDSQGKYTMKRSMRASSIDSAQQVPPSTPTPQGKGRSSFSVRSLSPTGSFFGRNRQNLRESMRAGSVDGGAVAGAKTMRGQNGMGKAPQGRTMRSSSAQGKPAPAPSSGGGMTGRFKSKFAQDSDDEDDGGRGGRGRTLFSSRFADSDDEDDGRPAARSDLAPVRGIPRRKGQEDGDSTDLSDEEDDDPRKAGRKRNKQAAPIVPDPADIEKAMAAARRNLGMTNGTTAAPTAKAATSEGTALNKGSLRTPQPDSPARPQSPGADSTPRRRGFMGSILRRNRGSSMSVQQVPSSPLPPTSPQPPPPGLASPRPMSPAPTRGGKLVRRSSAQPSSPLPQTHGSEWPLTPPSFPVSGEARPATSDGVHEQAVRLARTMRPTMAERGMSDHVGFAEGVKEEDGGEGRYGKSGGKRGGRKKFGMLRRAFGLDD